MLRFMGLQSKLFMEAGVSGIIRVKYGEHEQGSKDRSRYKNEGSKATDLNLVSGVSTVSPLHVNLQVANFQRFEHAVHVSNPLSSHVWRMVN